jgi:propionyl-CoA carboxylase alpha chain
VELQIKIAQGDKLPFAQEDLTIRGWAVEARVYAEDPRENFLPSPDRLIRYRAPQGPGIRVDDGFMEGLDIPVFYDPMISKLIAYGSTREQAIARLRRAVAEYEIAGPGHNLAFIEFILSHEEFTSGRFDTGFIENFFKPEYLPQNTVPENLAGAAALAAYLQTEATPTPVLPEEGKGMSAWRMRRG